MINSKIGSGFLFFPQTCVCFVGVNYQYRWKGVPS